MFTQNIPGLHAILGKQHKYLLLGKHWAIHVHDKREDKVLLLRVGNLAQTREGPFTCEGWHYQVSLIQVCLFVCEEHKYWRPSIKLPPILTKIMEMPLFKKITILPLFLYSGFFCSFPKKLRILSGEIGLQCSFSQAAPSWSPAELLDAAAAESKVGRHDCAVGWNRAAISHDCPLP